MNVESFSFFATPTGWVYISIALLFLFAGWLMFQLSVKGLGYLFGSLLSFLFLDAADIRDNLYGLLLFFVLSGVLGYIISRFLESMMRLLLAFMGIITALGLNSSFHFSHLFRDPQGRVLFVAIFCIISAALFVICHKHLIIFLSSLLGSIMLHRELLYSREYGKEMTLLVFLSGLIVQGYLFRKKRKKEHAEPPE